MTNIEQLKKETDEIKKGLEELKNNVSLSENEKKNKADALKTQVETTKKKIEKEIHSLENKTDDESKKKKEEAEALLNSFNETMKLYESILNTSKEETKKEDTEDKDQEEKGFLGKTGEWIGEQRDDVWDKEKWKSEAGKNVLRTAGFVATGVGAVALAYKGIKKLWNRAFGDDEEEGDDEEKETKKKKKKKKSKEGSRWKKFLIGGTLAVGSVVGGVEVFKHWNKISSWFKEKLGLALPFDEARQKVEAEVRNGKIDDDHFGAFNAHFDGITYDENTEEICSYGQKTKIDKSSKKLDDLPIEFPSWEEMIHAANIVNFAKRMLRGRGASATPFDQTEWGGDLCFKCSASGKQEFLGMNNSNERSWILGTLGVTGGGLLGAYCAGVKGAAIGAVGGGAGGYALGAYIDNSSAAGRCCGTIAKGANFDFFKNYLNRQKDENGKSLWAQGEEVYEPDDKTPVHEFLNKVKKEIYETYGDADSTRRDLEIERNEENPKEYSVNSYGHKLKLIVEGGPTKKGEKIDFNKIKNIHIEKYDEYDSRGDGLDIDFPHTEEGLKEAIRTANFTNKIVEDWKGKGGEAYPFAYGKYISGNNVAAFNFDMDTPGMGSNYQGGTCILTHDKLKKRYPTILKDLGKYDRGVLTGLQEKMHDQAIQDKSEGSQYIKYLHQIGKGKFWKKVG